jgi:CBS domain-containing protein
MTQPNATPRAGDYMTGHVRTLTPDMPLADVISFLLAHNLSSAPVIESRENGRRSLVGFVSEHDCLEHLSNELFYGTPSPRQTAGTIMRKHPVCVAPDTELFTLASIFVNHGMRHLPVVDHGELVGVISRRDILQAMEHYYREFLATAEHQRRPLSLRDVLAQSVLVTPVRRTTRE